MRDAFLWRGGACGLLRKHRARGVFFPSWNSPPLHFIPSFQSLTWNHFATTLLSHPCMEWGKGVPPLVSSSLPTVHYYSLSLPRYLDADKLGKANHSGATYV